MMFVIPAKTIHLKGHGVCHIRRGHMLSHQKGRGVCHNRKDMHVNNHTYKILIIKDKKKLSDKE